MKTTLVLILAFAAAGFSRAQEPLSRDWRWKAWREMALFTYNLPDPDSVELHLLDPSGPTAIEESDPSRIKIVATKQITGREARRLAQLWRDQDFWISYSASCHEPAYGMTVYHKGKKLFFASICLKCHNVYFYGNTRGTTGINDEDRRYRSLRKFFTEVWPDPTANKSL